MRRLALIFLALVACLPASEIDGIWTKQPDRPGPAEDLAFRFKSTGQSLTGKMFGDEFDVPISDASLSGDQIRFTITTTNYYNGTKTKFVYSGVVQGPTMNLVRERVSTTSEKEAGRPSPKQQITLKRVD
jgi:hypothetical protein